MNLRGRRIGLDIGTYSIKVCADGMKDIREVPSVACVDAFTGKVLDYGENALRARGRVPDTVKIMRIKEKGTVSSYDLACHVTSDIVDKICGGQILRPVITASVSGGMSSIEKKTLTDVLYSAGASTVNMVDEPVAAAAGVYGSEASHKGRAVLNIGAGSATCAIMTMNSVAVQHSIPVAGDAFNARIMEYLSDERNISIGFSEAERLKRTLALAVMRSEEIALVCGGKRQNGEAAGFEVTTTEMRYILKDSFEQIRELVVRVFDEAPAELVGDITESGLLLTGGSAVIYGMDAFLARGCGVSVSVPERPNAAVINGIKKIMQK